MVDIDSLPGGHAELEGVWLDDGADILTVTTAVATAANETAGLGLLEGEDTARLLPEGYVEVADVSLDSLDLSVGEELDVLVAVDVYHLRGQDTLRAV